MRISRAAWIGHSTVLMNFFGVTILTDPVLFPRIGIRLPFLTVGPKRLTEPALTFAELPPIDLVLLSHAHFDHIDRRTLKLFPESTRVITAQPDSRFAPGHEILRGDRTGLERISSSRRCGSRARNPRASAKTLGRADCNTTYIAATTATSFHERTGGLFMGATPP